jgi:hypothetical protein
MYLQLIKFMTFHLFIFENSLTNIQFGPSLIVWVSINIIFITNAIA